MLIDPGSDVDMKAKGVNIKQRRNVNVTMFTCSVNVPRYQTV